MNNALLSLIRNRLHQKNKFDALSSDIYHNLYALDFSILGRDSSEVYYQKLLQLKKKDIELLFGSVATANNEPASSSSVGVNYIFFKRLYTEWVRLYKLYFETFPGKSPREKARTRFYGVTTFTEENEYEAEFAVANIFKFLFRCLEVKDKDNAEIEFSDECGNMQSNIDPTVLKYVIWWIITNASKMTQQEINRPTSTKIFSERIFEYYFTSKIVYHVSNIDFLQWYFTNRDKLFKSENEYKFKIEDYASALKNQSYAKIKFLFALQTKNLIFVYEIENTVDLLIEDYLSPNDVYRLKQELVEEARAKGRIE